MRICPNYYAWLEETAIAVRPWPVAIGCSRLIGLKLWWNVLLESDPLCGREEGRRAAARMKVEMTCRLACSCHQPKRRVSSFFYNCYMREPGRSGERRAERPFRAIACNYRQSEWSRRPARHNGPSSPCSQGWALKCVQLRASIQQLTRKASEKLPRAAINRSHFKTQQIIHHCCSSLGD